MSKNKFSKSTALFLIVMLLISTRINVFAADTNIAPLATASTSFCSSWETVSAINDGYTPSSSADRTHDVYGNWDNAGTTQWVQYDFAQSYTISQSDVYWFSDIASGGDIDVPAACAIKYWNGTVWVAVSNPVGLGVSTNTFNTTTFTSVTTTKIRLEMTAKAAYSTGILEWKVWGTASNGGGSNDLVAQYNFNETSGTTAADTSGNGKNATLTSATFATGKTGNGLSLSGSTQYASLPSGIVSSSDDMTIATWVKLDTISSWTRIFDFGSGTSKYMFLTPSSGSTIRFSITNNGTSSEQKINGTAALTAGSWKHVAVTLSGDTGTLYVDGVAVGTNTGMTIDPSDLGTTTLNYIGKSQYSDPYLDGLVDDFTIYNRALSASEIASLVGSTQSSYTRIDDSSTGTALNQFQYVGTWNTESSSNAYSGNEHWSEIENDYVNIKFYGRQIKLYSSKDTDYGTFCVSIDGGAESSWSCWQVVRRNQTIVYESRVLPLGEHTLKVRVAGLKNPDTANTDTKVYIDFVDVYATGVEPTSPAHGDTAIVTTPPSWCDTFYTKCVMAQDIPIVSSNNVADSSLIKAFNIINPMLTKIMNEKPAVYQKLLDNSVKITVEGLNEYNMTLPEWTWQASCDFNATFRGSNGGREALILEDDIIASTTWLQSYCVLAHEFAHTILSFGLGDLEYPGADAVTRNQILAAYNAAIAANKYTESSYDRSNIHEYFAGNVGRWFNSNPMNLNVTNASSKTPRQQLQEYDPAIYSVVSALFGDYELPAPWN